MDTSPERILMCEKAVEVQAAWKPMIGDCYVYTSSPCMKTYHQNRIGYIDFVVCVNDLPPNKVSRVLSHYGPWQKQNEVIWLPYQCQLQEIAYKHLFRIVSEIDAMPDEPNLVLLADFYKCVYNYIDNLENPTMEQLWLVYVMAEKYNKSWDGTTWVEKNAQ